MKKRVIAASLVATFMVFTAAAPIARAADVKEKAQSMGHKAEAKAVELKDQLKAKMHGGDVTDPKDVKVAQQALVNQGYRPGAVDGVLGPRTHAAIADFQRQHGLDVTGRLDGKTLAALETASSSPSASPATTSR